MKKSRRGWRRFSWALIIALTLGGYGYWTLHRPLPAIPPEQATTQLLSATPKGQLAWPAGTQAAVGLLNSDTIETNGVQTPVPTASTVKLVTALVVLEKYPLGLNEAGPTITLTAEDVARYGNYINQGGSVMRVQAGQQLNQYQMLQAIMLPSANNIADTMAIWAYGSLPDYAKAANAYLAKKGLTGTRVGSDASGLAPDSTSTARDLVRIGRIAMKHPVLKQIANQRVATGFPLVDNIRNVNYLLGTLGIIGLKTGNSDQAGGAFVGAAEARIDGRTEIIITAVLRAPDRETAMAQSLALIQSAQANFKPASVIKAGEVIDNYRLPWGGSVSAIAAEDLTVSAWQGDILVANANLKPTAPNAQAGQTVGTLSAHNESIPIKLKSTPSPPPAWWRLTHPLAN